VIAIVVIFFGTAVMVGIIAALGAGLLALLVIPLGLAVAAWFVLAARTGTGPREIAPRESSQEFLGPGGPDDPTS
jgi:hypothetical protein